MNALAIKTDSAPAARPAHPPVLSAYLAELRCECARTLRNPGLTIPILIMPIALYLLFALVIAGAAIAKEPSLGNFLFLAFSVMGMTMPAMYGISSGLALDRELGLLRLKRAQPAPVGAWLFAKIGVGFLFGMLSYLPILATALLTGKLTLDGPAVTLLSVALVTGVIPFCALGLMIGALVKGAAAPGYANLIYLPGCYLSGLFFPLPQSMFWQAPIWPQFHLKQIAMYFAGVAVDQSMPVEMSIATLVGYTALFGAITYWRLARKG